MAELKLYATTGGKYAPFQNGFAFLTEKGTVYEKMVEAGFITYDLSQDGKKSVLKNEKINRDSAGIRCCDCSSWRPYLKVVLYNSFSPDTM